MSNSTGADNFSNSQPTNTTGNGTGTGLNDGAPVSSQPGVSQVSPQTTNKSTQNSASNQNVSNVLNYDPLNYQIILGDIRRFKHAGVSDSDFNAFDTPGSTYMRIFFHFFNTANSDGDGESGLLHPTWMMPDINLVEEITRENIVAEDGKDNASWWVTQKDRPWRAEEFVWWRYSTAYSYLIQNDEVERAGYLKKFIELLSAINSESPWYFTSIKGLTKAITREQIHSEDFKFKDRDQISIECLPDAVDARIGTMLDLYRAATYSWRTKRMIIPANLRKFDMTIVLIHQPIVGLQTPRLPQYGPLGATVNKYQQTVDAQGLHLVNDPSREFATSTPGDNSSFYQTSYKAFEFHNCEIDYNSSGAAYDTLNNTDANQQQYVINIFYDDMYEIRYNELMPELKEITDLIAIDANEPTYDVHSLKGSDTDVIDPNTVAVEPGANHQISQVEAITRKEETEMRTEITRDAYNRKSAAAKRAATKILGNLTDYALTHVEGLRDKVDKYKKWTKFFKSFSQIGDDETFVEVSNPHNIGYPHDGIKNRRTGIYNRNYIGNLAVGVEVREIMNPQLQQLAGMLGIEGKLGKFLH